jgi:hypothetical protein
VEFGTGGVATKHRNSLSSEVDEHFTHFCKIHPFYYAHWSRTCRDIIIKNYFPSRYCDGKGKVS